MNSRRDMVIYVHREELGGQKMGVVLHLVDMDNPQKTSHGDGEQGR